MREPIPLFGPRYGELDDTVFGGWRVSEGDKIGFSARDSQSARSLMIDVMASFIQRGIPIAFVSNDRVAGAGMVDVTKFVSGHLDVHMATDRVRIVDMTADEDAYDEAYFSVVDEVMRDGGIALVFEKQTQLRSRAFTVTMPGHGVGNSDHLAAHFMVTPSNPHDLLVRTVGVTCVKARDPRIEKVGFVFKETCMPTVEVVSAFGKE